MKFLLFMLLCLSFSLVGNAQNSKPTLLKNLWKANYNLTNVNGEYEGVIGEKSTMRFSAGVGISFRAYGGGNELFFDYSISPLLTTEYRNYYNIEKRSRIGKRIQNNSGNFLALTLLGKLPAFYSKNEFGKEGAIALIPNWGLQRGVGRKCNFQFQAGPGIVTDFKEISIFPNVRIGVGYVF